MSRKSNHRTSGPDTVPDQLGPWVPTFAGLFIGLALLKFSAPVTLSKYVQAPETVEQWIFFANWPLAVGYALLTLLTLSAVARFRTTTGRPRWLPYLPALWLAWQLLSASSSDDRSLTLVTLIHFASVVLLFYFGFYVLSRDPELPGFRTAVLISFVLVLLNGLEQHFGGLEATREMIYRQPDWQVRYPPEFLERIEKDRIFSTLFYPNSFAAGLILLTPLCALTLWQGTRFLQIPSRILIAGLLILPALAALYWTQSKSGWLVSLALVVLWIMRLDWYRPFKIGCLLLLASGGLAGFYWKYSDYFKQGATSVAARMHYWNSAWNTALEHPVFGSGPGTFERTYAAFKDPKAEATRLAHNDYLQQASDSGIPGALLYAGALGLILFRTRPRADTAPLRQAVWYGLTGFALQNIVEFGLYIPALAWTFFLLLGWSLGQNYRPHPMTDRSPPPASPA